MSARIRVIHNVADGPDVDVAMSGDIVLSNVPYKAVSSYLNVVAGTYEIALFVSGTSQRILYKNLTIVRDNDYTLIAHGLASRKSSISLLGLLDNNVCPKAGKAHVRFVHASLGAPAVDVYSNLTRLFKDVSYGSTGAPTYLPIPAQYTKISVTPTNSEDIVVGPLAVSFDSGKVYTIVASGIINNRMHPLTAIISVDNNCATVNI